MFDLSQTALFFFTRTKEAFFMSLLDLPDKALSLTMWYSMADSETIPFEQIQSEMQSQIEWHWLDARWMDRFWWQVDWACLICRQIRHNYTVTLSRQHIPDMRERITLAQHYDEEHQRQQLLRRSEWAQRGWFF